MKKTVLTQKVRLSKHQHRSGAALYTLVVFNAFLLGMLGLSALAVSRIERRQNQSSNEVVQARRHAAAGIALAKQQLDQDENWRTSFTHTALSNLLTLGSATIRYQVADTNDSDLADDAADGITITAISELGETAWSEQVTAVPIQGPPEFLKMSMHAGQRVTLGGSARVRMSDAPVSTNDHFQLDGDLLGDVECKTQSGSGLMSGNLSTNQAPKALPLASVFDQYLNLSPTIISYQGDLDSVVLTPGVNTYGGGTNASGLYYINPGKATLSIVGARIEGTLLIDGNVSFDVAAYLKNSRVDFPILIVRGDLSINLESTSLELSEAVYSTNFNPAGAEYLGSSDDDEVDYYPNRIEGLIHVTGSVSTSASPLVKGCLVCEGQAVIQGTFEIQHDNTLFISPPIGYELLPGPKMKFVANSWKRVAIGP